MRMRIKQAQAMGWSKRIALLVTLLCSTSVYAVQLKTLLKTALEQDPMMLEAQANEEAALSKVKESKALHYPTLAVTANQILDQSHESQYDYVSEDFTPGIRGSVNLYSFGAISAQVARDEKKSQYFEQKIGETAEELGYNIGSEYLKALNAHEALAVQMRSLERHNKFTQDVSVIVQYDAGRRSELTQARARQMQVEHTISSLQRDLGFALSHLRKYSPEVIDQDTLSDPFAGLAPSQFINRYQLGEVTKHPSYLAQEAELDSIRSEVKYRKAKRYPSINLEGNVTTEDRQVYLNMSWDLLNQGAKYSVEQSGQSAVAAKARLDQIQRDIEERARTAEIDMFQSQQKMQISQEQIIASRKVVSDNEKQFKIARKSLIDVLNAYNELASVEMAYVSAQNDYRMAALAYLRAQANISNWVRQ